MSAHGRSKARIPQHVARRAQTQRALASAKTAEDQAVLGARFDGTQALADCEQLHRTHVMRAYARRRCKLMHAGTC